MQLRQCGTSRIHNPVAGTRLAQCRRECLADTGEPGPPRRISPHQPLRERFHMQTARTGIVQARKKPVVDPVCERIDNAGNILCKKDMPIDATYHFTQGHDGAGDFAYTANSNIHKPEMNKPLLEYVVVRSRWKADGTGRSDARISGGEVTSDLLAAHASQTSVTASQCWDATFNTRFETSTPQELKLIVTAGDESKCAFTALLPQ